MNFPLLLIFPLTNGITLTMIDITRHLSRHPQSRLFLSLTGMDPWYIYAPELYYFAYVIFYSITILGIYFSYESYKELK